MIKSYFIDVKENEDFRIIKQEILTTRQLQHSNILPYLNVFVNDFNLYIVSPLMSYGSCSYLMDEYFNHGFPEPAIAVILRDVLHGLNYIHNKGLIHR